MSLENLLPVVSMNRRNDYREFIWTHDCCFMTLNIVNVSFKTQEKAS